MAYTRMSGKSYHRGSWVGNIPPSETYILGTRAGLECLCCRLMPERATPEYFDMLQAQRDKLNAGWEAKGSTLRLPPVDRTRKWAGYGSFTTTSRRAMLKHMKRHRKAGHAVPKSAYKRLWREYKAIGDDY